MENTPPTHKPLLLTIDEAARCLGVGRTKVYGLIRSGEFGTVRPDARQRILYSDLQAYVARLPREHADA